MNLVIVYSVLSLISVYSAQKEKHLLYKRFKTAPIALLIGYLLFSGISDDYSLFILLALIFSFAGDIFLLKEKYFLYGVVAFLVSHLFYFKAFINESGEINILLFLPVLFFSIGYFLTIRKSLKRKMIIPIGFYVTVISLMLWSALNLFLMNGGEKALYILIAAILFTVSDSVLAWNKFVKNFSFAQSIILPTYYAAQLLFVLSV